MIYDIKNIDLNEINYGNVNVNNNEIIIPIKYNINKLIIKIPCIKCVSF